MVGSDLDLKESYFNMVEVGITVEDDWYLWSFDVVMSRRSL